MHSNPTGFPDLGRFDPSIPTDAIQRLCTDLTHGVDMDSEIGRLLDSRGIIENWQSLTRRRLHLLVEGADTDTNEFYGDQHIVGHASYYISPPDDVCIVGLVSVEPRFRHLGIGTRLKKHLDNHAQQDGAHTSYTWLASGEGEYLSRATGYCPETDCFPDYPEIWVKHYR